MEDSDFCRLERLDRVEAENTVSTSSSRALYPVQTASRRVENGEAVWMELMEMRLVRRYAVASCMVCVPTAEDGEPIAEYRVLVDEGMGIERVVNGRYVSEGGIVLLWWSCGGGYVSGSLLLFCFGGGKVRLFVFAVCLHLHLHFRLRLGILLHIFTFLYSLRHLDK
ncbi:hypothetical protein DL98DRAFT_512799 [Cadophora sp. DSE1049]|nr:hypothetical protein DL98DRAFT_512799 [Cadophora sp. DSE1049]